MAISTYSELQAAIATWMARNDLSGNAADFIRLAEARLNRILPFSEIDTTLTGTVGSRRISVSFLSVAMPVSLWAVIDGNEVLVNQKSDGLFAYSGVSGCPSFWAMDGTNIDFDCPLDQPYEFRFRAQVRLQLNGTVSTDYDGTQNELLTNHPDVYLAASIVWGGLFIKDMGQASSFKALLDEFVSETRNQLRQNRRGVLTVDPALTVRSVSILGGV